MPDLCADAAPTAGAAPLTVFRADLLSHGPANWQDLVAGYTTLKAITFSSSMEFRLRLADRFTDMEVVLGSERILTRQHLALAQASQAVQEYGFADALVDQKAPRPRHPDAPGGCGRMKPSPRWHRPRCQG